MPLLPGPPAGRHRPLSLSCFCAGSTVQPAPVSSQPRCPAVQPREPCDSIFLLQLCSRPRGRCPDLGHILWPQTPQEAAPGPSLPASPERLRNLTLTEAQKGNRGRGGARTAVCACLTSVLCPDCGAGRGRSDLGPHPGHRCSGQLLFSYMGWSAWGLPRGCSEAMCGVMHGPQTSGQ